MPLTRKDREEIKARVKEIKEQIRVKEIEENKVNQNEIYLKMVNEFIVTELKYLKDFCNEKQTEINALKAENEQLKSKLKEMETVNKIYLLLP